LISPTATTKSGEKRRKRRKSGEKKRIGRDLAALQPLPQVWQLQLQQAWRPTPSAYATLSSPKYFKIKRTAFPSSFFAAAAVSAAACLGA